MRSPFSSSLIQPIKLHRFNEQYCRPLNRSQNLVHSTYKHQKQRPVTSVWNQGSHNWSNLHSVTLSWWGHQMGRLSALLALWEGNPPITFGFLSRRLMMRSFDLFLDFYLRLNKQLSKQWSRWWFETPSHSLWRHWNYNRTCHWSQTSHPLHCYWIWMRHI